MKKKIQYFLQKNIGFTNYLFAFSLLKIYTLFLDRKEKDFFFFLKLIPQNACVLDIGANLGVMSVHLARNHFEVISFEPMPENLHILKKMTQFFKLSNITIMGYALGEKRAHLPLFTPEIDHVRMQGLSRIVANEYAPANPNEIGKYTEVEVLTLDEAMKQIQLKHPLKAIKIDVENFEYFVLKGATETINQHQPIIYCELWANEVRNKCIELLESWGYATMIFCQGKLIPYCRQNHSNTLNFFFMPPAMQSYT